ncbi:M23 family metallopeptidase [Sporolactobacillus sp. Y61]|uniref:M23 family metallopeptidase n=1 Tax=Sporolactobacillus sp. Y61 TaxID=3160863 RepID=A0AAU8ICR6_9BACL
MKLLTHMTCCFLILSALLIETAVGKEKSADEPLRERKALYLKTSALTGVPWEFLAGCDQYARMSTRKQTSEPLIALHFSKREWAGLANPNEEDQNPLSIAFFGGSGLDGNGDGKSDRENPEDRLFAFAQWIAAEGPGQDNNRIAAWKFFRRGKAVEMIDGFSRLYSHYNTLDLSAHAFPLSLAAHYDYQSTWGSRRGWGGLRIHEGTDLFADYGTPVRSTGYGIIEMIGWNKYGGWRIGIRDIRGNYHYFAHLKGYAPHLQKGHIVEPGQEIGYVGSSGYGPPGTMGKFPPHLHYGLYLDNGKTEFSVDPYPVLRVWEREERAKKKATH